MRSIWVRHGLETFKKRLERLEERSAKEGVVYTEAQLRALEEAKRQSREEIEDVETHHPGYLLARTRCTRAISREWDGSYSSVAFAKVYTGKTAVTAGDLLNDRVIPFFEDQGIPVLRVMTDSGTEFCGAPDRNPYEVYLELNEIEHTKTRAKNPQTNGIYENFHQTVLNEFYRVAFRKKVYTELESLQRDVDEWLEEYNTVRTHQGKRCQGRTPTETLLDSLLMVRQNMLA